MNNTSKFNAIRALFRPALVATLLVTMLGLLGCADNDDDTPNQQDSALDSTNNTTNNQTNNTTNDEPIDCATLDTIEDCEAAEPCWAYTGNTWDPQTRCKTDVLIACRHPDVYPADCNNGTVTLITPEGVCIHAAQICPPIPEELASTSGVDFDQVCGYEESVLKTAPDCE